MYACWMKPFLGIDKDYYSTTERALYHMETCFTHDSQVNVNRRTRVVNYRKWE